jgi:hypothetical protein
MNVASDNRHVATTNTQQVRLLHIPNNNSVNKTLPRKLGHIGMKIRVCNAVQVRSDAKHKDAPCQLPLSASISLYP